MKMYSTAQYSGGKNSNYYKKPFIKTKGFYILIILGLLVVSFIYWSITRTESAQEEVNQKFTDQEAAPSLAARVSMVSGVLELKSPDSDWVEITENYQITAGDQLRTKDDAKAIVELPDKSLIRLSTNTEVLFVELGLADIVVEQIRGIAAHRVNDKSPAIYRVKNGETELTALGTAFNVKVEGHVTYLTVTENRVKVKVYANDEIESMRTIQEGIQATINPTLDTDKIIKSEEVSASDLLDNNWYAWNLEQDEDKKFYTGLFAAATKLVITEPEKSSFTTDKEAVMIKGVTDPAADIFIEGNEVKNNGGNFELNYKLSAGDNEITITVKKDKNLNKKILNVKSTLEEEKSITLEGEVTDSTANLSWEAEGLGDIESFKTLMGKTKGVLTYPTDDYDTLGKDVSKDIWKDLEDGEYFFRVCAYIEEDGCVAYSNQINLAVGGETETTDETTDETTKKKSGTINLQTSKTNNTISLTWSTSDNMDTSDGFRTLLSQSNDPTYPGASTHILKHYTTDTWTSLNPGTYYLRTCLLDGDSCVVYSNTTSETIEVGSQATLILSGSTDLATVTLNIIPQNVPAGTSYFVMMSENANVQYPAKEYRITTSTSYAWTNLTPNKTYYFRACLKDGDTCGAYSNEYSTIIK